jgi:transposase-like protein
MIYSLKGCNYTKKVKNTCIHVNYRVHMLFTNIVGLISHFQDATPSRQTVYNELRKYYGKLKLSNFRTRNYSGNYAYDEQYIKLNGVKYYIFSTILHNTSITYFSLFKCEILYL